jgi:hypothetical protein
LSTGNDASQPSTGEQSGPEEPDHCPCLFGEQANIGTGRNTNDAERAEQHLARLTVMS